MSQKDGPSCPGCGLSNYEGMCPHCRGDQAAHERELVPPFQSYIAEEADSEEDAELIDAVLDALLAVTAPEPPR